MMKDEERAFNESLGKAPGESPEETTNKTNNN